MDLVIDRKTDVLPIEVKFKANTSQTGIPAFRHAFTELKIPVSLVITKDRLDRDKDTLYVPFWMAR